MKENKRIIKVLISICLLFFMLIGYLTYFQLFESNKVALNPYNKRRQKMEDNILRGTIYDRNGVILAKSKKTKKGQVRIYPFGSLYSQVIGYNSKVYGKSLLESSFNNYLLGISQLDAVVGFNTQLGKNKNKGDNLYLTIDNRLQKLASELMAGKNGAVIAMNPKNGEVLAMVSNPSYNTNEKNLSDAWRELTESDQHPFVPRATQGLYAPGSTYKVATSAAAIEKGFESFKVKDSGRVNINGKWFSNENQRAHGQIGMKQALEVSSNVYFSQLGVKLGSSNLKNIAERFGLNKNIPFDIPVNRSIFPYTTMGDTDLGAAGMGQGKLMVTPLEMALITSTIANDGIMMKPILVKRIVSASSKVVEEFKPQILYDVISSDVADKIKSMMEGVVDNGTGRNAKIYGIRVAGKTGTAENELSVNNPEKEHTWFISLAPVNKPKIVVSVVMEYSGSSGGTLGAPIARELISKYLKG